MGISFRFAERGDAPLIHEMILALARHEGLENEVISTVEDLERTVFDERQAEVLLAVVDGSTVGFALFFHNYSTFLCRHGLYIEDLYIKPEYRHKGYGRAMIKELCRIARDRGCGRVEWWCLDDNTSSVAFYKKSLGAEAMEDWTVYRLDSSAMDRLVGE